MATRVLQRSSAAPLLAAIAISGLALKPSVAHAEASVTHSRKPIYDSAISTPTPSKAPPPTYTLSFDPDHPQTRPRPTPTDRLAVHIGKARLFVHGQVAAAEDKLNSAMDSVFALEQSFTSTVASLAPARETGEQLMPGVVYVVVASMAGTIIARNRNVLLRASAPLAFGLGAAWAFLPVTSRNVSELAWRYEQRFPALARSHVKARESIERSWDLAKIHSRQGVQLIDDKVTQTRESVEGWVRKGK